ncbi:MAG TPA: hypothetical protein VMU15_07405 [Anaeromyxobacter sp.]|nr:hypothetical protein [Anaeromyxobacter sp.]
MLRKLIIGLSTALVVATGAIAIAPAAAHDPDSRIVPPNEVVFARAYGDWAAQWWQWALSLPAAAHPLFDTADCSAGQSGPVWFLGGKFCATSNPNCSPGVGSRACTVPAGKYLFIPVLNGDDSYVEELAYGNPEPTIASMRAALDSTMGSATKLSATIDGIPVRDLLRYREQSPVFSFTLPTGDLFTAIGEAPSGQPDFFKPGPYFPIVDDGVYLMIEPLRPGKHTIHTHGEFTNFIVDVTYQITVACP